MKLLRPLLLILGGLAALLVAAVAVLLLPPVQKWAVLRAAARSPGLKLELGEFAAGPTRLTIGDAKIARSGVTVTVGRLEAGYSLVDLLLHSRLELDRLTMRGLAVDATRLPREKAGAGAAVAPVAAPGALAQVTLPYQLVVDRIDVQGTARLPGAAGRGAMLADFTLGGGGLTPGKEGAFHLQARLTDPTVSASVGTLQARVDLLLKQTARNDFDHIGLNALIEGSGPTLSGGDQLRLAAELLRGLGGENYRVRLDTVHAGASTNLLALNALLPTAGAAYRGDWSLTARAEQIEPFAMGNALPRFNLRGAGAFTLNPADRAGSLQGGLQGRVGGLEALRPDLRAIGEVGVDGRFDFEVARDRARLNKLDLAVTGDAPVLELHTSGAAAIDLRNRRLDLANGPTPDLLRIKLIGLPLAWLRPFVGGADVSGGALTGEFTVGAGEGGRTVVRTVVPLSVAEFNVARGGRLLVDRGSLAADADGEITASSLALNLRRLAVKTAAGDTLDAHGTLGRTLGAHPVTTVTGAVQADLPRLLGHWAPGFHLRAVGEADLAVQDGRIEWHKLSLSTHDGRDRLLASLALAHPFALKLADLHLDAGTGEVELATLRTGPTALAALPARLVGSRKLGGELAGAEFAVLAREGRLVVTARTPVRLAGVAVREGDRQIADGLSAQFSPVVELDGRTLVRAATGEVVVADATGAELARTTLELTQPAGGGLRGALTFNANLAALSGQPFLDGLAALQTGRASGEVRAAQGGGVTKIEVRSTLNNLVLREGNQALPVANLSLQAQLLADGHFSLQVPILLDRSGTRSDLNLSAEGIRTANGLAFDARLAGEQVDLADALALVGLMGGPTVAPGGGDAGTEARTLSPPAADTRPFWAGFEGQVTLDVKSVARGKDWTMTGLTGRLVLEPARVQLQKLTADFGEKSRLEARGGLTFTPAQNPYALQGDFSLTEFDAGKLFKALEPGRPPTVEGRFTIAGHLEGQGLTLDDTLDRVRGELQLTSRQGIFRGLKRASDKLSVASKAVELGAALGSLLGTEKVKQAAERMAGHSYLIDQFAQMLAELNYDQLSLRLVRDQTLNVQLQDLTLVSPEVHLLGSGQVTYEAGKKLLEQPLSVSVTFAGRGRMEQMLDKLRELDGTRDDLGYAKAKNAIVVGGTMAKPDPSGYFTRMASSKLTDFLVP